MALKIQPSNTIQFKERTIKARIDQELRIKEVIKQVCKALDCAEPPSILALRDGLNEDLVTTDNLAAIVKEDVLPKVVKSQSSEALDTVSILSRGLDPSHAPPFSSVGVELKLILFRLQKRSRKNRLQPSSWSRAVSDS